MSPSSGRSHRNRWRAIGARVERAELFLGGHPVRSVAALEDVGRAAGQAIGSREYPESVAVEADQPLGSCEPDEPFGIDDDAVDSWGESVTGGENSRGKALGPDHSGRNEQKTNRCKERPLAPTETQ
jgi:hypothetical protein